MEGIKLEARVVLRHHCGTTTCAASSEMTPAKASVRDPIAEMSNDQALRGKQLVISPVIAQPDIHRTSHETNNSAHLSQ